jgi:hypothetical protein
MPPSHALKMPAPGTMQTRSIRQGGHRGPTAWAAGVVSQGRRIAHGVDAIAVGLAMEVIARVAERKLLMAAAHQSPDEVA